MALLSFLDKHYSVAKPGYSRWLVPPAALSIHLAIGQVYAFSVFKTPLSKAIGITQSIKGADWTFPQLQWIFSLAIAVLGLSAALFGKWLENAGPRKAMFAAAVCFGGGFMIAALGSHYHMLWVIYAGYGFVGGIGLGLGYISPISTLVKWFIDRPGMATGFAIMGFGGGAMIAAPLSTRLMNHFQTASSNGVSETFIVMGILYFCFMMFGVFTIRTPAPGWKPEGYVPKDQSTHMITSRNIDVGNATRTPQFLLLWLVLCLNVMAGISILEQASPLITDLFGVTVPAAAGFVGLLSLFNMLGRFGWSSLSDVIGRKATYCVFFLLGPALLVALPFTRPGHLNNITLFVSCALLILTMYGGGFATMPAYIRDLFGTAHLSAILGRILTAWSVAGILGPLLVNNIRQYQIDHGVAKSDAYSDTFFLMAGLLVVGLICNMMIRPVSDRVRSTLETSADRPSDRPLQASGR
jgi:MFS family permease